MIHRLETILTENGTLTLQNLPFQEGDVVEVIVSASPRKVSSVPRPSAENPYPLRDTVYRYDDPTEPAVALEDWEVLK